MCLVNRSRNDTVIQFVRYFNALLITEAVTPHSQKSHKQDRNPNTSRFKTAERPSPPFLAIRMESKDLETRTNDCVSSNAASYENNPGMQILRIRIKRPYLPFWIGVFFFFFLTTFDFDLLTVLDLLNCAGKMAPNPPNANCVARSSRFENGKTTTTNTYG